MRDKISSWLAVASLAFSAFVFNATEMAPVGLLTAIGNSFDMSAAHTGYIVTIYAWTVAVLSLPLTVWTAKLDRKKLLIALFCVFIVSHLIIGAAQSFWVLAIGRIGVACAHAIFWSIAAPLAVRVAPEGSKSKALGALVTGSSLAMVMGVPLGTLIGKAFGWRVTFFLIALGAALALLALIKALPNTPSKNAGNFKSLPFLLTRSSVVWIYVLTAVIITGDFAAYTYFDAFFESKNYESSDIVWLLFAMGGAGFIGAYFFGLWGDRFANAIVIVPLGLMSVALALLEPSASNFYAALILCLAWGTLGVMVFMSLQSRLLSAAKDATDVANSIYSGIFNVGIGGGAFVGSIVLRYAGVDNIGYVSSAIVAFSFALCAIYLTHSRRKRHKTDRAI
ncbi:MAG: sugar transporter [Helicobacteraceae bacterium]|jgi:DHA1 family L-arabinose/isopropyl-beta-D-thiogalactopyranoside export protein-like MFS transporter|nr:sugar transporter [Helicobacteraceae bacterium]